MKGSRLNKISLLFLSAVGFAGCISACAPEHEHTYGTIWAYDDNNHFHLATCEHSDLKTDVTAHTYGEWVNQAWATETTYGIKERTCTVCGCKDTVKIDPHTHTYGDWKEVTPATETEYGLQTRTCSICGYVDNGSIPKIHAHTFGQNWEYDDNNHWNPATCEHAEEKKNIAAHSFGDWATTKQASETETGEKKRTCSVCNYSQVEIIPVIPHTHTYESTWSYDATSHFHKATCTHGDEKADITPHSFGDWIIDEEATSEHSGVVHRTCSVCNYKSVASLPYIPESERYETENYYNGYYSPIFYWENGEDLKNQLHKLIRTGYTGLVYEGNWETNQIADQSLTNFNEVNVVYSQKDDAKIDTNGSASAGSDGWQREHALCASLMTSYNTGEAVGIKANGTGRATDFHNLFAAYGAANGARGNKNLGIYNPSKEVTSAAVDADTHADDKNYEPNDCDKGRLARAIFYMGVMYNEDEMSTLTVKFNYSDNEGGSHSKSVSIDAKYKPIEIVENYVDYSQITFTNFVSSSDAKVQTMRDAYLSTYRQDTSPYTYTPGKIESNDKKTQSAAILADFAKAYSDYRYNEGNFGIGNLSTLLNWNSTLVDRQEMWHNEVVYSYVHQSAGANKGKKQGNRNPFVDYPELVDYVYGSKKNQPGTMNSLVPSEERLKTNLNELYNYALTSHVDKYLVGQTLTNADYTFVRVNKDFTTQTSDFEDANAPYTFVESDIGTKKITLTTPTGAVSYDVVVESTGGVNACNYNFMIDKNSFSKTTTSSTPEILLNYGDVRYYVSTFVDGCKIGNSKTYAGIGTGTDKRAETVTIETADNFEYDGKNQISSVYIGLNTPSGCTYQYKISIGETMISSGNFIYESTGALIYGVELEEPLTGKLKIELINCTKAVYISQISVKLINEGD